MARVARLLCVLITVFGVFSVPSLSAVVDDEGPKASRTTDPLDKDEFLGQISMAYLQSGFQDRVDGFSGYLHINAVDIRLPGNAGMEIVVQRYYSSNVWNRVDNFSLLSRHAASADPGDHLGGSGWQLHMGKIINPFPFGNDHATLIMPDGSTHPLFNRSGYPGEKITLEGWIYTRSGTVHQVTLTNGLVYEFDTSQTGAQYQYHDGTLTPVIQCTRVEDVNGNAIDIVYSSLDGYHSTIESISFDDTSDNRVVEFTYISGTNRIDLIRVKNGTTVLQTWDYGYGSSQGNFIQNDATSRWVYPLTQVEPPEGDPWVFAYNSDTLTPGDGRYLLQKATLPSDGSISYTNAVEQFETGSQTCVGGYYPQFAAVQTRTVKDRDNSTIGTWSYVYTNPGEENATTTITVKDGSNATVRIEEKAFHGWGAWVFNDPNMWKVGLTKSSTIRQKSSPTNDLEVITETTTWQQGDSISGDTRQASLWNSCASSRQMTGITYVNPTDVTKVVRRTDSSPASDYTTTSSSFDNWGNPSLITETGDINRTTEIQYWQDAALNIMVGRVEARDPDPGGTECYKYDALGRLSKKFINPTDGVASCGSTTPSFGRETRYSYDSDGNLYQEQVENGTVDVQTTYTNYTFGHAETMAVENGSAGEDLFFCKNILPLGTVDWETDGRGTSCLSSTYRTNYDYDALGRLTIITPPSTSPQSLATSFVYLNDWSRVTVTRGSHAIQYLFDGIGRLSERKDLETQHKVLLNYDPFGTRRQATTWYGPSEADTLDYDVLGRLTTITRANNDSVTFTYNGSKVTRTDEELHSTQYFYEAFGNPDDRRLFKLIDANTETTEYSYDPDLGLLSFVYAPISRGDRSFTYYKDQGNHWSGFLYRETHKETGNIDYEYDRLGNVTKRTRANGSEETNYNYDRTGRLTDIDYPDPADDVTIGYDQAGNRTLLDSPSGTFDYSYDNAGRLEWKQSTIDVDGPQVYLVEYEYDEMDRVAEITYPSGRIIEYGYDNRSWLTSVGEASPSTTDYITSITYHPSGAADLTTFANGVETDIGLDNRYRIETSYTTSGATTLMNVTLGYDKVSNLETWTDNRDPTGNRSFSYDNLDRLLTATAGSMWGNLSFTYDDLGNRLTRTLNGAATSYNYSDTNNRLTSLVGAETATFGYDAQGRQTNLTAPDTTPPENVTGISATALTDTSIGVFWTNSTAPDASQVEVYGKSTGYPSFRGDGDLVCTITPTLRSTDSCTDSGLVNGKRYFYTVFVLDEEDNVSSGAFAGTVADVCPACDKDVMIGLFTADLKGVQNTGTFGSPPPTWQENPDWDFLSASGSYAKPALADMDNDGDLDLFVGFYDGRIKAYENIGSRETPQWQVNTSWQPSYDIGSRSAPAFADFDGDGDFDIMAGNSNGQLEAYRNNGDAENPGPWSVVSEWTDGLPDVGSYAAPVLYDTNNDDIYELLVGTSTGNCLAFQNVGTRTEPVWSANSGWSVPDTNQDYAVPALLDLDGDGDVDVLVGDRFDGKCYAYEHTGGTPTIWTRASAWDVLLTGDYLAPAVGDLDHELLIFSDGFESGDTSAWSSTEVESKSLGDGDESFSDQDRLSNDADHDFRGQGRMRSPWLGAEKSSLHQNSVCFRTISSSTPSMPQIR